MFFKLKVRPNRITHLKNFRSKFVKQYKLKKLKYGQYGIKILNYIFLTARHLNRYKIMMQLCVRRGSLVNRSMWVRYNISIPLTKKPKGSRMGSGKGKLFAWGFKTFGGTIFFELKNVYYGRAHRYYKKLRDSLNCNTKFEIFKVNPISGHRGGCLTRSFNNHIYLFNMLSIYTNYLFFFFLFSFLFFILSNFLFSKNILIINIKFNLLIILIFTLYIKLIILFNVYGYYSQVFYYYMNISINYNYYYYFPFLFIFILITSISLLFCLNYNYSEISLFLIYCGFILFSGFNLFFTNSLLILFFFYECLLIPSFMILYTFSKTRRSVEASYLMFFWTQFGALWLIFSLIYVYAITGSFSFEILSTHNFSKFDNYFLFICFLFGFGVKLPIWPFYEWLPKAHVEASTNFSIFLSGVLVKFAFFGFFKCLVLLNIDINFFFIFPYLLFGLIDSIFKMFYQIDVKKLIAYSTVVEMHWLLICLINGNNILLLSAFGMFISHAILSTNSFLMVDSISRRFKTRLVFEISGLNYLCPKLFLYILINLIIFLGFPGSLFFISEILFFTFLFDVFPIYSFILFFIIYFLLANFFMKIWLNLLFGSISSKINFLILDLDKNEIIIFSFLIFLIFWLGSSWLSFFF